jgi:hypothetical protein
MLTFLCGVEAQRANRETICRNMTETTRGHSTHVGLELRYLALDDGDAGSPSDDAEGLAEYATLFAGSFSPVSRKRLAGFVCCAFHSPLLFWWTASDASEIVISLV